MPRELSDHVVGTTIGSFRISKVLGRGGMGTVYLGEHTVIGSRVAIKILQEKLAAEEGLVARFYAEARAVNLIGHENIVNIFDMNVVPPKQYYFVMEYLDGRQLNSLLTDAVPAAIALPILIQVCDALQAAHDAGVVHRDLKPENIFLLKRNKNENFVKVLDFGLAKLLDRDDLVPDTAAGLIVGTPEFMSPEQTNSQRVDGRSDVYSLGCIAWLMAVGKLPFPDKGLGDLLVAHRTVTPPQPSVLEPDVPQDLSAVIMTAMEKDPEKRFPTARAFGEALEDIYKRLSVPKPIPLSQVHWHGPRERSRTSFIGPDTSRERRYTFQLAADVTGLDGTKFGMLQCQDISKGGMFFSAKGDCPDVFARVKITIPSAGGLTLLGQVVRHVPAEQANAWEMEEGFGVRFIELTPEVREEVDRVISALPQTMKTEPPRNPTAKVQPQILKWRDLMNGDHYVILSTRSDADMSELAAHGAETEHELELLKREATPQELLQLEAASARVEAALAVLTDPVSRARYDAHRGNFRGVAKCIVVGLSPMDLERLRHEHVSRHATVAGAAHVKYLASKGFESQGRFADAAEACEAALRLDPLNLQLHQRLAVLRRRIESSR